ncbi:Coiled-coil domain-containing protein [Pseudocercospora fuligena]|uniref:Vacuolar ATPase assembly protein VMA22 n=1 Tax=Pseudocercospora fuligena TaxID=685502 RepID=A0A8H6RLI1_9PEZI|nr:Coiled-coil domain-containing protein [Pseudocercospora fuligena]
MRGQVAVRDVLGHTGHEDAEEPSFSALNDQLDSLWTRYLDLLDQYTKAQASIKKHMSSGFFSLAQANSKSAGLGRRYGQDYYDDRTSATTKVQIIADEDGSLPQARIVKVAQKAVEEDFEIVEKTELVSPEEPSAKDEASSEVRITSLPTPEATPEPDSHPTEPVNSETSTATPKLITNDPIRWFGILVPPPLRQAQTSFTSAVLGDDAFAQASNAARGMRDVEVDIRKLRKTIKKAEKSQGPQAEGVMG